MLTRSDNFMLFLVDSVTFLEIEKPVALFFLPEPNFESDALKDQGVRSALRSLIFALGGILDELFFGRWFEGALYDKMIVSFKRIVYLTSLSNWLYSTILFSQIFISLSKNILL